MIVIFTLTEYEIKSIELDPDKEDLRKSEWKLDFSLGCDNCEVKLCFPFFLSDPLDSRIPDVEYEKEYKVASKYFSVGLINQERLFEDNVITTTYKISNDDIIVYRGWMLKPQLYDRLVTYVEKNGGQMFTNLSEYEYTHLIPNWVKDNSNHVKPNGQ